MGNVIFNMSVSLDGFVAGPHDEVDRLFGWYSSGDTEVSFAGPDLTFKVSATSAELFRETWPHVGAAITGRRNFDIAHAWGGRPPLGIPHFVLTHHVPQEWLKEDSPFTFVTDGITSAVAQAKQAAGDKHVAVSTATTMQQCLREELLDELHLDLVHVLLGDGIRLFNHLDDITANFERIRVVEGTGVTHLHFRLVR